MTTKTKDLYCPICKGETLVRHCQSKTCPNWYVCKSKACQAQLSISRKFGTALNRLGKRVRVTF